MNTIKTINRLARVSICALLLHVLILAPAFSQVPEGISYQAIVRNASGQVRADASVSVTLSILQGSITGTEIFSETHSAVTNSMGLINLVIGSVNTGDFGSIDWSGGPYFIRVEVDGTVMGTSQLLSVPFAFYARHAQHGDDWGAQSVEHNATLDGNGTSGSSLGIADNGVSTAKIANNAVTEAKIADNSVTADKIANLSVNSAKIANNGVTEVQIADNSVTTAKIANGNVTGAKLAQGGATSGQVLKWSGSAWAPGDDQGSLWSKNGSNLYYTSGSVGIGDATPNASLDVEGTVIIGSAGRVFTEIREITGTTASSGSVTTISYPSGYTNSNTRVLAAEINYSGTNWNTMGMTYLGEDKVVGVSMGSSNIFLHYPDNSVYYSRAYRLLLMKVN